MSVIGSNALAGASGQGSGGGYVIEKSLRFKGGSDASLTRTPTTAGSQSAFTLSTWVKRSLSTTYEYLMWTTTSFYINFTSNDKIEIALYAPDGSSWAVIATSQARFRDPSAWYHIVVSVDSSAGTTNADRLKLWVNGVESPLTYTAYWGGLITGNIKDVNTTIQHEIGAGNYPCDFYLAEYYWIDGQGLDHTSFGAFDDNNVWRPKEFTGTYGTNGFYLDFADGNDIGNDAAGSNNWTVNNLSESGGTVNYVDAISGDPQYTINAFSTSYISNYINTSTWAITNTAWTGAWDSSGNTNVFTPPGGIAVSSSLIVYFGNYNNGATTTTLTITYTDSSTETDTFTSGNNNWMGSFTASNAAGKTIQSIQIVGAAGWNYQSFGGFVIDGQILTSLNPDTDVLRDSPTNGDATADTGAGGEVSGNYCTMNPLANYLTLANGNLDVSQSSAAHHTSFGTLGVSSGKWYWEITKNDGGNSSATSVGLGVANVKYTLDSQYFSSSTYDTYIGYMQSGVGLYDGSSGHVRTVTALGSGVEHTTGTWMFAFDFDNGKGWIGKDGTWLSDTTAGNEGDPANGSNPCFNGFVSGETYVPIVGMYAATSVSANFGQRAWKYAAPSGFKALCTTNLPTPDVPDGSDYFDAVTYTGNSSTNTITGLGFSPDFLWIKARTVGTYDHALFDSVRGADKVLYSSLANGQATGETNLTSFDSNGFTLGSPSLTNLNTYPFIAWTWDAGDSTVPNTDGSITTSVRANQTAGFSIVSYTSTGGSSATIGHGLNAAPDFVLCKRLDTTGDWWAGHVGAGWTEGAYLQVSDAFAANSNWWNDTAPTSSVVTLGSYPLTGSSGSYIAYCFTSVAGYSAFGSYTGNGNANGPFVYTDFRPAFVIVKNITSDASWCLWDSKRPGYNLTDGLFNIDNANAEANWAYIDVLSNGFKVKGTHAVQNTNTDNYIYAAFAENPFQANGGLAR